MGPNVIKYPLGDIMGKPRMTQRDQWKKRPVVLRFHAFKDELRFKGVWLPNSGYHLICVIPMPKSWNKKERAEMNGTPHQQKPDKDNIEKGIMDALVDNDELVWDGRVSKYWGEEACLYVKEIQAHRTLEEAING